MKHITAFTLFFLSLGLFAQIQPDNTDGVSKDLKTLNLQIQTLISENNVLRKEIFVVKTRLDSLSKSIKGLNNETKKNNTDISNVANQLGIKIEKTEQSASSQIKEIDNAISKKTMFGIIGVLSTILLSGLLFLLLKRRQKADNKNIIIQLSQTKNAIEEKLVKQFEKQTELLETQLKLAVDQVNTPNQALSKEIDHSLALKVADEITLIERNISLMDKEVKGLKQLLKSVQKLKDNLNANGYEIPELLGKKYNHGMKVIVVSTISDENIEKDLELITKIIKPQVNYLEEMIQTAQIETTKGF